MGCVCLMNRKLLSSQVRGRVLRLLRMSRPTPLKASLKSLLKQQTADVANRINVSFREAVHAEHHIWLSIHILCVTRSYLVVGRMGAKYRYEKTFAAPWKPHHLIWFRVQLTQYPLL